MSFQVPTQALNKQFEIKDVLSFEEGAGGFVFAKIRAAGGSAEVCLHGGHVTSFVPNGEEPVLWLSPEAVYREGKAIRGGVPICWPWFHDHPNDPKLPSHGYARLSPWEVVGSSIDEAGIVMLELRLDGDLRADYSIEVSDRLSLELTSTNRSDSPVDLTGALHSYLNVGDIKKVRVEGLGDLHFRDDVEGGKGRHQLFGGLLIDQEIDRRYGHRDGDVLVHDEALGRSLRVSKFGSATTVIWNPWVKRAAEIGDMPADGYLAMLCVEAANADPDHVLLEPGESQVLGTTIGVE